MNRSSPLSAPKKLLYAFGSTIRRLLPRQQSHTFGAPTESEAHRIEQIYVINLDRQPDRWSEMRKELDRVLDSSRSALTERAVRFPTVDAMSFPQLPLEGKEVDPFYTLGDQLLVEPQPSALPDRLELSRPIRMSQPEVAVAYSHISVWRHIATGEHEYALVLEDDAWFHWGFAGKLDRAWAEMDGEDRETRRFDILYLSYEEVRHGAGKTFVSRSVFRPVQGLWHLSGYVLSREGAAKLLALLPCRGPVDLWINHQFGELDVLATKQSIIGQRRDAGSTNSYSILPALTKIGVLNSEGESLFRLRPQERPVFAFGAEGSGLSSLAMALSMLGYRCCSDLQDLPATELEHLLKGRPGRVFDAYVNIGSLQAKATTLAQRYPQAKFIVTEREDGSSNTGTLDLLQGVSGDNIAVLSMEATNKWAVVCEHLRCPPPGSSFPERLDVGQRRLVDASERPSPAAANKDAKRDRSPWVVGPRRRWRGIHSVAATDSSTKTETRVIFKDNLENLTTTRWLLRDDTFTGNLALFRPSNVETRAGIGAALTVRRESLGVREYSAGAISSRDRFVSGRFEVELRATKVPGIVTGFFLHRDSPRQEIDVEIVGKRSDRLLANVFYNPGDEEARFDYGFRGSPSWLELGFDASESFHRYAIEWSPGLIRWLVDDQLAHERVNWDPTPIPQLPMTLHVNTWPSRSRELAGRLAVQRLPAFSVVRSISVQASSVVG